jgi:hypothetical protein
VDAYRADGEFAATVDRVAKVCKRYGAKVVTDQYAAAAVVERLRGHGLSVRQHNMTASSKTAVFGELRARLYDGTLELYEHPSLIGELRRLRTKFSAGRAAVENPRVGRSHGDQAAALSLAVYELRGKGDGLSAEMLRGRGGRSQFAVHARPTRQGGSDPDLASVRRAARRRQQREDTV